MSPVDIFLKLLMIAVIVTVMLSLVYVHIVALPTLVDYGCEFGSTANICELLLIEGM